MEAVSFLAAPFFMCVALVGIHCYLGLHVLHRGVIFVDLALAQVAAFGSAFAFLLGFDHHDLTSYFISLGSTLVAALFLAYSNRFRFQISQEAIIGVIYALASAAIILLMDKVSHGAEHLKQSLIGNLLWVTWADVLKVVVVYGLVGAIHYFYRHQFFQSSLKGGNHWIWDFLFYGLFGVVITSSVHYAGVLLVFSFLIVPAIISSLFYKEWRPRLIFGWVLGTILSLLGMILSYQFDLPSGAAIVVVFTLCPILMTFLWPRLKVRTHVRE
ncbi:MAG: ABC transporter [Bdellovibrionaceae bacterium]|nr:ABC transporter [Pseudobdellovibrionaceae bacterium]|tara:strand:- start:1070 stop:1882 length:813 start_codon:yes stop_codon:yes gene_type:complete